MAHHIIAIDQGTTSSRAVVFDKDMQPLASAQKEFKQYFPNPGWVEHDPEEIWETVVWCVREALAKAGLAADEIAAIGITNQRETTLVWDRKSGKAPHRAIVWQDRRTAPYCNQLREAGYEDAFTSKTGLLLDPYFSGTKLKYLLDSIDGAREAAEAGELLFGTVDSFLIWRLTGGAVHLTDATNASRTLLYNIVENCWDDELLGVMDIPRKMLPDVRDCSDDFGTSDADLFGAPIPIRGVAGDQQAALIGQACFKPGMIKATYGTGGFAIINTGTQVVVSQNRLLTTIAYRLDGQTCYALEGSIFVAGAAVQWLRDGLGIIDSADQTGALACKADPDQDVFLVPAFVGLAAPWWDPEARGAIFGITRGTGPAEFARAALESVCFQTYDLLEAMHLDWKGNATEIILRADGGMVASDWTMQRLSDILDAPVDRPVNLETTVLGAAWLAGSHARLWPGPEGFSQIWSRERRFEPEMAKTERATRISGWRDALQRTLTNYGS